VTTHTVSLLTPPQAQRGAPRWSISSSIRSRAALRSTFCLADDANPRPKPGGRGALASHARGERLIFTAEAEGRLDGTVQLILAPQENPGLRADLAKLLGP